MKNLKRFSWTSPPMWAALCAFLFSFSAWPGAHSYKVYLDSKLVLDQYIDFKSGAPKLMLNSNENYHQLIVKYSECGRTVTGRKLTVKDGNNKILKEWQFEGTSTGMEGSMTCNVKDILALQEKGGSPLKMYYSSNDFPQGWPIANLVIQGDNQTALK